MPGSPQPPPGPVPWWREPVDRPAPPPREQQPPTEPPPRPEPPPGPPAAADNTAASNTIVMGPALDATQRLPPVPAAPDGPGTPSGPLAAPPDAPGPAVAPAPGPASAGRGGRWRERRSLSVAGAGALVVVLLLAGAALLLGRLHGAPAQAQPGTRVSAVAPATIHASASSTQVTDGGITYAAGNTLDGTLSSAWNSNGAKDGPGPGISLTYRFASAVQLREITIRNGYQKVRSSDGTDLWPLNERVRRFEVVTDTGHWTWDLRDLRDPQTLRRDFGSTTTVQLRILEVYPSRKYRDVAVSEISFAATP